MSYRLRQCAIAAATGAMALSLSLFSVAPAHAGDEAVPTGQAGAQQSEAYGSYELFLVEDPDDPHYLIELEGAEAALDGSTVNIYSEDGEVVEVLPDEIETPGGEHVSVDYEIVDNGASIKIYPDVADLIDLSTSASHEGGMQAMSDNCARNTSLVAIGRGAVTGAFAGAPGGPAGVTVGAVAGATSGALEGGIVSIFLCE